METPEAGFWRQVDARQANQKELQQRLEQDTENRAAEAHALMDQAELPGCSARGREELLRDTTALLFHAAWRTAALVGAGVRLQALLAEPAR